MGFPWLLSGKESPANAGDVGSISKSGRFPGEGNGNPLQYSCLRDPMDRGAWPSMGSQGVRHDLGTKPPPGGSSLRNLQGTQDPCVRMQGQRPIYIYIFFFYCLTLSIGICQLKTDRKPKLLPLFPFLYQLPKFSTLFSTVNTNNYRRG